MNSIILSDGQKEGFDKLKEWIKKDIFHPTYSLTGKAGTGKTTLIDFFLKECGLNNNEIIVTAPTHAAKKVVAKKSNRKAETIQKLLGLRLDTDVEKFDPEKAVFSQQADPEMRNYKLVVIDESSMINSELYKLIVKEAKQWQTKVLFTGDRRQLPPVNEQVPIALINEGSNHDLVQVVRQKNDNPLLELLDTLVGDIENGTKNFNQYLLRGDLASINSKGEGYIFVRNKRDFFEMAIEDYKTEEFSKDLNHCKILAWTNTAVNGWNQQIRNSLHRTLEPFVPNDIVTGYKTIVDEYNALLLTNSEDYIVHSVSDFMSDKNVNMYKVTLMENETFNILSPLFIVKPSDYEKFVLLYNHYYQYARVNGKRGRERFLLFRNKYLVHNNINDSVYEQQYGEKLFVTSKDIDYGYAITVHKSQGSTYENVYVDLRDIAKNFKTAEKRSLLYVALSRASKKAVIFY
jgi:exodeoxyribonuclease-5